MIEGVKRGRHATPETWADAFPWLRASTDDDIDERTADWADQPIESDRKKRLPRVEFIAAAIVARQSTASVKTLMPTLPPSIALENLEIPIRGRNILSRTGCTLTIDLDDLTPIDMLDWQNMGVGTLDGIFQALVENAAEAAMTGYTRASAMWTTAPTPIPCPAEPPQEAPAPPPQHALDLRTLADWSLLLGTGDRPLLAGPLPEWAPEPVRQAHDRLLALVAADVAENDGVQDDIAARLNAALNEFDSRQLNILARRMFADDRVTLDRLGTELDLTRERVRQIERKTREELTPSIAPGGPIGTVAAAVRQAIGRIMPLAALLELVPALARTVDAVGQPAWRVLDRIDESYEIADGWCMAPSRTDAQTSTRTLLDEQADRHGVVRLDTFDLIEATEPQAETTTAWLSYCGYIVDGDHVFTRTSSVGDYAAALLSVTETPMSSEEITDRFAFGRSPRSLRNSLSSDERFNRVDVDRWALIEWDMETYAGIRPKIDELVAQAGGQARLDEIIEYITTRYSVSATSVLAYASSSPFENRDGIVRIADTEREIRKSPEQTRRLFRREGAWAYRVRITADHLRGSGSPAPVAIAGVLDLRPGATLQLENPLGAQAISWTGNQPQFGTIRRFLQNGDIQAGTEAFLIIGNDGTFAFEPVHGASGDAVRDALTLVGAPPGADPYPILANAVGLSAATPVSDVIAAYRERGDVDVADLLTRAQQESTHVGARPSSDDEDERDISRGEPDT